MRGHSTLALLLLLVAPVVAEAPPPGAPAPPPAVTPAAPSAEDAARLRRLLAAQVLPPAPALSVATTAAVTARDGVFRSAELQREMKYRVLLPPSYDREHRHYPVLYLLHGFLNPFYEWDRQTSLARQLERYEVVVVLVEGDNSFYLDSAGEPKDRYLAYFFRDLLPEIRTHYRVMSETYGQAIAGVSMGGYGALLYGLRFPGAFAFVGSFAGVPNLMRDEELLGNLAAYGAGAVFGPAGGATRTENDVMALLDKVEKGAALPYFFLNVGNDDEFAPQNLAFAEKLRAKGVRHELLLLPGGHEWDVWDRALPAFFDALARVLPGLRRE